MKRSWKHIAVGIGFCPFWWQWGVVGIYPMMIAFGPFRIAWKSWR